MLTDVKKTTRTIRLQHRINIYYNKYNSAVRASSYNAICVALSVMQALINHLMHKEVTKSLNLPEKNAGKKKKKT